MEDIHELAYDPVEFVGGGQSEVILWQQLLAVYRSESTFDRIHTPEQTVQIKNKTFVLAVFRCSAVKYTAADQEYISGLSGIVCVIQMQMEAAGQDPQDLPFLVPVERHLVAGMPAVYIVILNRKFQCAMLFFIMKSKRMHMPHPRSSGLFEANISRKPKRCQYNRKDCSI